MTQQEAECYRAMKRWQRKHLKNQMRRSFLPRFLFPALFVRGRFLGKTFITLLNILALPLILIWWCIRILKAVIFYPVCIALSYNKPKGLHGPGERNIKGIHYQFASHVELPHDLYIDCVNEWISLLYGADKLPKYQLENYLDKDYLQRRNIAQPTDPILDQILATQISNAREELSRDLGHY
jgi:hypothetical protein